MRSRLVWGFADQALSSVTNFALVLLAGRWLDPSGLGVVTIGFAGYVLALVVQRALIGDPLVIASVREEPGRRDAMTRAGLTSTLLSGGLVAGAFVVLGLLVPGPIGRGLLIVSPWIVPLVVQDLWRFLLFRDDRGRGAAANDALWLLGMGAALPLPWLIRSDWAVMAWWALGATVAAGFGFLQLRVGPEAFTRTWGWWRREIWPFGRWLAGDRAVNYAGPQVVPFVVAGLLGSAEVGGLRAVQSVFAPMTLLGPTVALPGLPAIAAGLRDDPVRARSVAVRLTAFAVGASVAYTAVLSLAGAFVLRTLFGREFGRFTSLIVPIAVGQVLVGAQSGFVLLLKAAKRGRQLLVTHVVSSTATLVAVWLLVRAVGITGAAWGLAIGDGLEAALYALFAWPLGSARIAASATTGTGAMDSIHPEAVGVPGETGA